MTLNDLPQDLAARAMAVHGVRRFAEEWLRKAIQQSGLDMPCYDPTDRSWLIDRLSEDIRHYELSTEW